MENQTNQPGGTSGQPPTIRLTPAAGGAPLRPKIQLQKPSIVQSAAADEAASTPVNLPPVSARKPDTVMLPPINMAQLDTKKAPIVEQSAPKTIKLKRPGATVLTAATASNLKKETSRVDINAALADQKSAPAAPKTIKLKRPGASAPEEASPEDSQEARIDQARKSETSRIELPAEATVEAPKQRKTVSIKRPGGGGARMVLKPMDSGDDDAGDLHITIGDDETTILFSLVSLAATIVVGVLIYVLTTQTVAPTWPWPGKII